jgi:hypothetical protein
MTKLALFIFLGDAGAPSVHAGDTKDAHRDVFDVCNQFVINELDRPISFGFTRTGTARAMIMATISVDSRICERALHAHSPTADSNL